MSEQRNLQFLLQSQQHTDRDTQMGVLTRPICPLARQAPGKLLGWRGCLSHHLFGGIIHVACSATSRLALRIGGPPPGPPRGRLACPELNPAASMLCGWRGSFRSGSGMGSMVLTFARAGHVSACADRLRPPACWGVIHNDRRWLVS